MVTSFAFFSLFAVAYAQTSTSSASGATQSTNPLIPTGISSGCSTYLTNLNSDATISACIAPLQSAVAAYGPGGGGTPAMLTSTLDTLCTSTQMCSQSVLRSELAKFQNACSAELQSNVNNDVVARYDALYIMYPFKSAVCSKDDSGKYCVAENTNGQGSTNIVDVNGAQNYLYQEVSPLSRRDSTGIYSLNDTTWVNNAIPFLGLKPSLPSAQLCVSCTRAIMAPYISFESDIPYSPGFSHSTLLSGQPALYSAIQSTCGSSFLSGAVQAAGGLSGNGPLGKNSASRSISGGMAVILGSVFPAVVALF